ncbi:MAG: nicotinate-nucleotide diphosphorylase (carboxylating), partial [Acidobacteriota bacterium]|nr:nicotinate-nucleotide diphosphorylase (carboxylating) [Acidobacteriota bacterium]
MLSEIVRLALAEDIGTGDVTTNATVPEGTKAEGYFLARESLVFAGTEVLCELYADLELLHRDGAHLQEGDRIANVRGDARTLLQYERVALNFVQRLSGVATLARQYASAVEGTRCRILDTRKTTPG